ncbi:hypothetical protein [Escherichia coli]
MVSLPFSYGVFSTVSTI